jgi:hypothetical protein
LAPLLWLSLQPHALVELLLCFFTIFCVFAFLLFCLALGLALLGVVHRLLHLVWSLRSHFLVVGVGAIAGGVIGVASIAGTEAGAKGGGVAGGVQPDPGGLVPALVRPLQEPLSHAVG